MVKKKKWNITKLIAAGSFGVFLIVINAFGASINIMTNTSLIGGSLNGIFMSIILILCLLIIDKFGSSTIMMAIYGLMAMPFFILGPPGFLPKILISLLAGVIGDAFFLIFKKKDKTFVLITSGSVIYYFFLIQIIAAQLFNIPGQELTTKFVFNPLSFVFMFTYGMIGGYLGYVIYNKIKNTSIVKRIQR